MFAAAEAPYFLPALTFAAGCALIRGKPGGIFMIHFHPEGTSRGIAAVWGLCYYEKSTASPLET